MRLKIRCPLAMKSRSSPVCPCCKSAFRSAPAMKIDFFAEEIIRPRNDAPLSIRSTCSFSSFSVAASKMFAPDSGRSNVSTQTRSSPISRRIIEPVKVTGIGVTFTAFRANSKRRGVAAPLCRGVGISDTATERRGYIIPIALRNGRC